MVTKTNTVPFIIDHESLLEEAKNLIEELGMEHATPEDLIADDDPHALRDLIEMRVQKRRMEEAAEKERKKQAEIETVRKALQAELGLDSETEEATKTSPEQTAQPKQVEESTDSKKSVFDAALAERIKAEQREAQIRQDYPLLPSIILLPQEQKYRLENAMAARLLCIAQMRRLADEKVTLEKADFTDLAAQCYRHRGWVKKVVSCISEYIEIELKADPKDRENFASRDAVQLVEDWLRESHDWCSLFRTFISARIERYADFSKDFREQIMTREQQVRDRALSILADEHKLYGRKVEVPLDQVIMTTEAKEFCFTDGDRLIKMADELVEQVLIMIGRKDKEQDTKKSVPVTEQDPVDTKRRKAQQLARKRENSKKACAKQGNKTRC